MTAVIESGHAPDNIAAASSTTPVPQSVDGKSIVESFDMGVQEQERCETGMHPRIQTKPRTP